MDKEEYLEKLFDYLKANNHTVIKEYNVGLGYFLKIVSLTDNDYFTIGGYVTNHNCSKFSSKYDFSEYVIKNKNIISSTTTEPIQETFFIKMFKEAPQSEKSLMIKNVEDYIGRLWRIKFLEIFNQILNTPKEISYLNNISIATWEIGKVSLKHLDELITSKGLNEKEHDDFYLKFFKSRKNQIKNATWGPEVKKFLVNKYGNNEEKLRPYCYFSNYIREIFEEIDLDIIEPMRKITVVTQINCRKAANLLCIPNHNEKDIANLITSFVSLMRRHKNIDDSNVEDIGIGVIEIRCYTDNPFTQEELNKEIKDYLLFRKKNPDIPLDAQNIEKYFIAKDLQSELSKNNTVSKKIKL